MPEPEFYPTLCFGFILDAQKEQVLSQMWVSALGDTQWRAVPLLEVGTRDRPQAVAGFVPEEDE